MQMVTLGHHSLVKLLSTEIVGQQLAPLEEVVLGNLGVVGGASA